MSQYQYIDKVYNEERRLIQQAERDKRLVFFVGAGASIPSGMPSWKEAIEIIKERMDGAPQDDFLKISIKRCCLRMIYIMKFSSFKSVRL